jgi:hypothetical protein
LIPKKSKMKKSIWIKLITSRNPLSGWRICTSASWLYRPTGGCPWRLLLTFPPRTAVVSSTSGDWEKEKNEF